VLKRVRSHEIEAGQLIGMDDTPGEVRLEVSKDGRTKSFVLGKNGTPGIAEFLADAPPAPHDPVVRAAALELAVQHSDRICGASWTSSMAVGDWINGVPPTQ
ncbi:hypothetical protein QUT22_22560, partial [Xanthomonas citri pv. citri]